jgi:hypothetical protein
MFRRQECVMRLVTVLGILASVLTSCGSQHVCNIAFYMERVYVVDRQHRPVAGARITGWNPQTGRIYAFASTAFNAPESPASGLPPGEYELSSGLGTIMQKRERVLVTVQHSTAAVREEFVVGVVGWRCPRLGKLSCPDTLVLPA